MNNDTEDQFSTGQNLWNVCADLKRVRAQLALEAGYRYLLGDDAV